VLLLSLLLSHLQVLLLLLLLLPPELEGDLGHARAAGLLLLLSRAEDDVQALAWCEAAPGELEGAVGTDAISQI
jgi:hypothetical protein